MTLQAKNQNVEKNVAPIFEKLKILSNSLKNENFEKNLLFSSQEEENTSLKSETMDEETFETQTFENPKVLTGYSKTQELRLVKIGLASSERIVEWATKVLPNGKVFGEVLNPNTLHYKTFKPHKGGLFCERIFGPLKDFECACGMKQKPSGDEAYVQNILETKKSKRNFCKVCDVEYTWSVIRRYQLGYIQLISPVTHLWYLRTNPSYLALLLDLRKRDLESIIYCMQITTLEYYWKPKHSLQLNLTASSLFDSYRKFLELTSKNSEKRKENLTKKQKKRQKEIEKRQNFKINRQAIYFSQPTAQNIQALRTASLETKIASLEKAYEMSSGELYPNTLSKISRITGFLKQKVSRIVKKRSFLMVRKKILQDFYWESYPILLNRTIFVQNQYNPFLNKGNFEFNGNNAQNSETNLKNSVKLKLMYLTLKTYFSETGNLSYEMKAENYKKEFFTKQSTNVIGTQLQTYSFSSSNLPKKSTISNQQKVELKHTNVDNQKKSNFVMNFLTLVRHSQMKKKWDSIYENKKHSLEFLVKINSTSKTVNSLETEITPAEPGIEFLNQVIFLYLLDIIQKNSDSFLNDKPSCFVQQKLLQDFVLEMSPNNLGAIKNFKNSLKTEHVDNFEFLSKVLQTNFLLHLENQSFDFFETKELLKNKKNKFVQFFQQVINEFSKNLLETMNTVNVEKYVTNQAKSVPIFFSNANVNSKWAIYKNAKKLSFTENQILTILANPLNKAQTKFIDTVAEDNKIFQFVKNTDFYSSTSVGYIKNLMNLSKNLSLLKKRKLNSSVNIFNNIYTVGYSEGWETEKDWKYFLYYNTAPIEMSDKMMVNYQYRFLPNNLTYSSFSFPIPIISANLIQKMLFEYEGYEVKKMATQYQNLLPKLNRYIRYQKQMAVKKSDYLEIQKLLQKRDFFIRRLKLLRKIFKKNSKASSMVLNTLPVLPPDLRPILKMQNQIAASDLNRFYQRILYRNDRLKKFLRANASLINYEPGFEIKYAQRLLQEAVDNLIQNGKGHVKPETNSRGQPLKSLSEILKGKQGRFRQYLLGKRVDYSGRSVIVVGPTLKIYECGLPFEMAMELFLPFLIKRIFQYNLARTVMGAKTLLQTQKKLTWDLLEEVMKNHPILLNRAPTLHRLGIQAFQPKLIEGRAILLHPLVCPAFNADFDGDQMAVHVPITVEARTEAWKLMFSRNHLVSPATGEPMLLPSQDMVLGCYYLTTESLQAVKHHAGRPFFSGTQFYFSNMKQILQAYLQEKIHLQTPVWIKWNGSVQMDSQVSQPLEIRLESDGSWSELRPKIQKRLTHDGKVLSLFVRTTAGRVLFNSIVENCLQTF